MKRKIIILSLFALLLSLVNPHIETSHANPYMEEAYIDYSDTRDIYEVDDIGFSQRNIAFQGQGHFFMRRVDFKSTGGIYSTSFLIPGDQARLTYFENKTLVEKELENGKLPLDTIVIIDTDKYSMILSQAFSYKDLGRGTKDASPNTYPIEVEKQEAYWKLTYRYDKIQGKHGILWGAGSSGKLVDLEDKTNRLIWANYDLTDKARLGEDGYYYASPSTYEPSSPRSYWRNPSMYIAKSWIKTGGSLGSDILGRALLILGLDNINDEGYFPTLPESQWLSRDFNIGPGFFDTRFNADIGDIYLEAYRKFSYPIFKEAYLKLAAYYGGHAYRNHYQVFNGGPEGWLVADYSHKEAHKPTHVSLNHQIHAANLFLQIYEEDGIEEYEDLGLKMLNGIKNTRDRWIKEDLNLHYSYGPEGNMGGVDYPYLSYNDLYLFQNTYLRLYGKMDEDIRILMDAKKIWMDNNNINEYIKP